MILPLMSAYNTLYDEAAENYGLITTEMAERNGVSGMSLVMLERRGRLQRVGRGVYRQERGRQLIHQASARYSRSTR